MKRPLVTLFSACFSLLFFAPAFSSDDHESKSYYRNSHHSHGEFVHGITVYVDGKPFYFEGVPDGPNGEQDIPGHTWLATGRHKLVGQHYNTGPFGSPQWWSSDADDGALLWTVEVVIDRWNEAKSVKYYSQGYVHYHALVSVKDGTRHPTKVAWLKHVATMNFTFDGVPPLPSAEFAYAVKPGVDYLFPANWDSPYHSDSAQ